MCLYDFNDIDGNAGLALLRFRMELQSDPYGALANWDSSDSDPCQWTGIGCVDGEVRIV